jgi:hypothetical protein
MILRSTVLLVMWLLLAGMHGARAQEAVSYPAPVDMVAGATGVTYADLLRLVVPDLEVKDAGFIGTSLVSMRHIDEDFGEVASPGAIETYQIAAFPLGAHQGSRLALFFDLGVATRSAEGFAVLALFDVSGAPTLLDVANVGFDSFTFPLEPYRLDLGGGDLLLTASTHYNSSQGYATVPLILVRGDRLSLVDAVFNFDDSGCAYHRIQRIDVSTAVRSPMADIVATVTESTTPTGAECGDDTVPAPPERIISVTYAWNAVQSRYVPDSDAFEVLAAENEKRF